MRFPVYPEWYRRNAYSEKTKQRFFFVLSAVGIALLLISFLLSSVGMLIAGICFAFVSLCLAMAFRSWRFVLNWVEFDENGISVKDEKGNVLRNTEYRYVRYAEIRTVSMTLALKEVSRQGFEADLQGFEDEKIILAYIDSAYCFEDLQLNRLGGRKHLFYWCDEVLDHRSCIVMAYNEEAWILLQSHLERSAAAV